MVGGNPGDPGLQRGLAARRHPGQQASLQQHRIAQEGREAAQGICDDQPHIGLRPLAEACGVGQHPVDILECQGRQLLGPSVQPGDPLAIEHRPHRPARPPVRQSGQCLCLLRSPASRRDEAGQRRAANRRHGDQLATRKAGRQQMIGIGGGKDEHGVGRRLLQCLQQAVLRRLGHPLRVGQQRHPERRDKWLQAQKLLQRLIVRLRAAFGMKADLIDADRLGPIVRPEVGVNFQPRRLTLAEQQLLSQGARDRCLANAFFTDQAVRVGEPSRGLVRSEHRNGAFVAGDRREAAHDHCGGSGATGSRCWHRRHLNKSFLDGA